MGDEVGKGEEKVGGAFGVAVTDPEIGPKDAIDELLEYTEEAIRTHMMTVLVSVAGKSAEGSAPHLKFMTDFAERLKALKRLPQEEYESFAAVLWRESQALEAREQGIGNRE